MHLILNLSQNFIVTDFDILILLPFKVTLTIISQIKFHFNLTFSGVNVPIILNKCIRPAILHNLIGTQYWMSCINNIILTALENKCPLLSFNIFDFRMAKCTKPEVDKLDIKIMYYCVFQVHSIFGANVIPSCLVSTPTSFMCCKTRPVTKALSFVCLHSIYITIVVTYIKIIAVTNRKKYL